MALSTDVELSVNVRPQFPHRCIVCSGEAPDTKMDVGDLMVGWFSFFTDIPDGWGSVTVPVHSRCKKPFKLRRWLTRIGYVVVAFLLWWQFSEQIEATLPAFILRPGRKVILFAMMVPLFVIDALNPQKFDINVGKYYITFEFADKRYAAAFAKQNNELRRYQEIMAEMHL